MKSKRGVCVVIVLILLFLLIIPFAISAYMNFAVRESIITETAASEIGAECILVLGAGVRPDGTPSLMLRDRLDRGIQLYNAGVAPKLLLSGDNGQENYDEVNAMKQYVLGKGIPAEDIFLDHAGFSTYESLYRAKAIFQVEKVVVITQKYHLYRSLYIAKQLGLEAHGVQADGDNYAGQSSRDVREFLAKNKDFFVVIFKPKPTYLGDQIPISGDGRITFD